MKKIFWGAILIVTISSISVLRAENILISTQTTSLIITAKKGKTLRLGDSVTQQGVTSWARQDATRARLFKSRSTRVCIQRGGRPDESFDALQRILFSGGGYILPGLSNRSTRECRQQSPNRAVSSSQIPFRSGHDRSSGHGVATRKNDRRRSRFVRQTIATYKRIRSVVQQGDFYRLTSPYENTGFSSLMYVTPKKERAIFFVFKMRHFRNMPTPALRMAGLEPQKHYMVWINARGKRLLWTEKQPFSRAFLMQTGLNFSMGLEYASRILELTEVE